MACFENWSKKNVFQHFKSLLNFHRGRLMIPLSLETLEISLKKKRMRDLIPEMCLSLICMTKHLNLARIQGFSKRSICICLGLTDCNRWIFHLRWEAADPGIRGEENRGWVGRKVEMWAAGACSCEVPGHRDNREHGGNGMEMASPERGGRELLLRELALGSGVWEEGSGVRDLGGGCSL